MNKKQLAALTQSLVKAIIAARNCTENEARTLVGMEIRSLGNKIVASGAKVTEDQAAILIETGEPLPVEETPEPVVADESGDE